MVIENIYPKIKLKIFSDNLRTFFFRLFLIATTSSIIVNICVKGKAWSVIVASSLYLIWKNFISYNLFENNLTTRITQFLLHSCILLFIIEKIFKLDFAPFVIEIICFSLLILLGTLFFSNYKTEKKNQMPLNLMIIGTLFFILCYFFGLIEMSWPLIVLISIASILSIIGIIWFRKIIIIEWKKRFH